MSAGDREHRAARLVAAGATLVSLSVLADSAMEHYRASFRNPAMVLPLLSSGLSIVINGGAAGDSARSSPSQAAPAIHVGSVAVGALGLGFHLYNLTKQPGGIGFTTLFYHAPIGAPAALILVGILGAAGDALTRDDATLGPVPLASSRAIGAVAAVGIAGTAAEAALLHFRGAYHNPAMWLPVTLPPVAALSLARDVIDGEPRAATKVLLGATALLGLAGTGFHAYGIHRNMGGWRNWRQNLLAGPPLPAPPAFTGLAIAALGAMLLMRSRARG